jgi:hypothetical protein
MNVVVGTANVGVKRIGEKSAGRAQNKDSRIQGILEET